MRTRPFAIFLLIALLGPLTPLLAEAFFSKGGSASSQRTGFLLEPAVQYSVGVLTQTGVSDIGVQSMNFDLRLGYKISRFEFGINYFLGSGSADQAGIKEDYKPVDFGVFAAFEFPRSLKLNAGYIFSAKTKINSAVNAFDFSGSGFRIGLSYNGFPYVNLGFEQIFRTYSKYDETTLTNSLKDSTTAFSLSMPLFN